MTSSSPTNQLRFFFFFPQRLLFLRPTNSVFFFPQRLLLLRPTNSVFFFSVTSSSPTNQLCFFFQEQYVLSLLDLLLGLQRKSKDCEKDYYKNKTQKPINTEKPSLVSVTVSLKQILRLPGARRNHFDVCFPGYNGGQAVPQHLDTAPTN